MTSLSEDGRVGSKFTMALAAAPIETCELDNGVLKVTHVLNAPLRDETIRMRVRVKIGTERIMLDDVFPVSVPVVEFEAREADRGYLLFYAKERGLGLSYLLSKYVSKLKDNSAVQFIKEILRDCEGITMHRYGTQIEGVVPPFPPHTQDYERQLGFLSAYEGSDGPELEMDNKVYLANGSDFILYSTGAGSAVLMPVTAQIKKELLWRKITPLTFNTQQLPEKYKWAQPYLDEIRRQIENGDFIEVGDGNDIKYIPPREEKETFRVDCDYAKASKVVPFAAVEEWYVAIAPANLKDKRIDLNNVGQASTGLRLSVYSKIGDRILFRVLERMRVSDVLKEEEGGYVFSPAKWFKLYWGIPGSLLPSFKNLTIQDDGQSIMVIFKTPDHKFILGFPKVLYSQDEIVTALWEKGFEVVSYEDVSGKYNDEVIIGHFDSEKEVVRFYWAHEEKELPVEMFAGGSVLVKNAKKVYYILNTDEYVQYQLNEKDMEMGI